MCICLWERGGAHLATSVSVIHPFTFCADSVKWMAWFSLVLASIGAETHTHAISQNIIKKTAKPEDCTTGCVAVWKDKDLLKLKELATVEVSVLVSTMTSGASTFDTHFYLLKRPRVCCYCCWRNGSAWCLCLATQSTIVDLPLYYYVLSSL